MAGVQHWFWFFPLWKIQPSLSLENRHKIDTNKNLFYFEFLSFVFLNQLWAYRNKHKRIYDNLLNVFYTIHKNLFLAEFLYNSVKKTFKIIDFVVWDAKLSKGVIIWIYKCKLVKLNIIRFDSKSLDGSIGFLPEDCVKYASTGVSGISTLR